MPTYEYRCDVCGEKFEFMQSITEDPVENCPKCGGSVRRLIGAGAGIIFKGSGFYVTDYRKNPSNKKPESNRGTRKDSGGNKGTGGTETDSTSAEEEKGV